jgi:hypothetical protein
MDVNRCAVCGDEYDAAYDQCPACARGKERAKAIVAGIVTVVLLALCGAGAAPGLVSAFMAGLTG